MGDHSDVKWNLRANDMSCSWDFDGILTFVGPQVFDELNKVNEE